MKSSYMKCFFLILSMVVLSSGSKLNAERNITLKEYYRLSVIPSFGRGLIIKLENNGNEFKLRYGWIKSNGTCKLDSLKIISQEEWNGFLNILDKGNFWTALEKDNEDRQIVDGVDWQLEGSKHDKKTYSSKALTG